MKTSRLPWLLIAVLFATGPDAGAAERFDRTKARIDALLDRHRKAEPLPAKPANPFMFALPNANPATGAGPSAAPAPAEPPKLALANDDQILAFAASKLKITGQVQRGGVAHLLINSATYREGDLIPVRGTGETVYYVRISRIAPGEVVFAYNDAVLTIPLKN